MAVAASTLRLLLGSVVPLLLLALLSALLLPGVSGDRCAVSNSHRSECGYIGITLEQCEANGCCWRPTNKRYNTPFCFHARESDDHCRGYRVVAQEHDATGTAAVTEREITLEADSSPKTFHLEARSAHCGLYSDDIKDLTLKVDFVGGKHLRVRIVDREQKRYQVPSSLYPADSPLSGTATTAAANDANDHSPAAMSFSMGTDPFWFAVTRKEDRQVLFNSSRNADYDVFGELVYEDRFIELSTQLPLDSARAPLYGLGEHVRTLQLSDQYETYTLWNLDVVTPPNMNLYGSHPFYLQLINGKAHGVLLLNSNGMDVFYQPGALSFRTTGGVIDLHFFSGPQPQQVVQQYTQVVGRPHLIPLWSLGLHQCRYGYMSLDELEHVVAKYREAQIPLQVMWSDIEYMDQYKDFTLDPVLYPKDRMQKFVQQLHQNGQQYVVIVDPGIKNEHGYRAYETGLQEDIYIKRRDGSVFIGKVWPGYTAFPDFLHPKATDWWHSEIDQFMRDLVPVDGLWIDMNEPSNFCNGECDGSEMPWEPYHIDNSLGRIPLSSKTVPTNTVQYGGLSSHDVHNLYGFSESIATYEALQRIQPKRRPFVLSRSTFPGSGRVAGHWTGDNHASWHDLYHSIPGMLMFNMAGVPFVGSDICGFMENTNEELCTRWIQLGAFYPFTRNHNTLGAAPQEFYHWQSVTHAAKKALATKYSLLPYYYSLFYEAHVNGTAPMRPLFFEFTHDQHTYRIDWQFMVGPALMVCPVLLEGAQNIDVYLPAAVWYDYWQHTRVGSEHQGTTMQIYAPLHGDTPLYLRGGHIVPKQQPAMTIGEVHNSPYELLVALDSASQAQGKLALDDGETPDAAATTVMALHATSGHLKSSVLQRGSHPDKAFLDSVRVLGVQQDRIGRVLVDGEELPAHLFSFDAAKGVLIVHHLDLLLVEPFTMQWRAD